MRPLIVSLRSLLPAARAGLFLASAALAASCGDAELGEAADFHAPDATPVVLASRPPPPLSGGTLLVTSDGRRALVADADRDRLVFVDLDARSPVGALALDDRAEPGRAVLDHAGRAHVVLRGAGTLLTVDLESGRALAERPVCPAPRGVAFEPDQRVVLVACAGGELVELSADPRSVASRRRRLDPDLRDVVATSTGTLVTRFRSADATKLGPAGDALGAISLPTYLHPRSLATFVPRVAWRTVPTPDGGALVVHQRALLGELPPVSPAPSDDEARPT